jgi:SAM dependent carboxyl methyltransferase
VLSATGAASKTTSEVNRFQQEKETARCRTHRGSMSALWKARAPITGTPRFQHRAARSRYRSSKRRRSRSVLIPAIDPSSSRITGPPRERTRSRRSAPQSPESYLQGEPQVFPYAIGRSFYRSLFPPRHVNLGWSSYAAVWLSQIPLQIPDHFFIPCSTGAVRAELDRQAARDWEAFLTLRAAELRAGGRLVVALPALDHDGTIGFASMMNHANAELFDLVAAGAITAEERGRMTIAACPRREKDLLAPFARDGLFHGLAVEHSSTLSVPDVAWIEFQQDRDAAAFASKRAAFFRAVFVPSMSQALAPTRGVEERQEFADRLEEGVQRRIASNPASLENMVGIVVLNKQATD